MAALVAPSLTAELWRSEAADGVLWLLLHGALAGGRSLALCACYHRPPAAADHEEAAAWYERRAAEWQAAVAAGHVPALAGDLNAHVGTEPDWPAWEDGSPRNSTDSTVDARGRLLLQFCRDMGARIVNGRVAGDEAGATTSYGVQRTARSVVDYFILPASYLTQVRAMHVSEEPLDDHSSLTLMLEGAAGQPACPAPPSTDPCHMRFPCPRDPERAAAAVAALSASAMLPALEEAARRARTPAEVEQVAQQRCVLVAAVCQGAGIRQPGSAGSSGRGAGSVSALPGHIQQRYRLRELRTALRQARRQHGSPEHVEARRRLQRAQRQARQAHRDERAQRLEGQFLTEHDAAGFYQAYRGARPELPDWVLRQPEPMFEHFRGLLDPPPPPPPIDLQALPQAPEVDQVARRPGQQGRRGGENQDRVDPHGQAYTQSPGAAGAASQRPPHPQASGCADAGQAAAPVMGAVAAATPAARVPHPQPAPPTSPVHNALRARMEAPFTADEVLEVAGRTPLRKAVVGPLAPWLLKPASQHLAPLIAAEFNAWRRVGCLPPTDALSAIALVPKTSTPAKPSDFRGIAVGALLAKLYAAVLESRVSAHAEAAGVHAEGQFGFRRGRSTEQAVLVLRTLVDSHRQQWRLRRPRRGSGAGQLWAAFIDFRQAYDRVPRQQLWAQMEQLGYGGEWLRAVRAIYASVPMTVSVPGLQGRTISSTQGLKQGCPLSPTLFSLYIADFEQRVLAAAQHGGQLDLPQLAGQQMPPLLYADDMALLATSAAGLQRQLQLLETYCAERGLEVNLEKTKAMLLAGADGEDSALQLVQRAQLTYAGQHVKGTTEFKYLGVVFHATRPLGESAAGARAAVARFAAATFEGRCAEMGLEAARLLLLLYHSLVDSTLSYCAAVWAPGLAYTAARRSIAGGSGASAAEQQHHRTLRRLLGLPQRAPTAAILAEAGEPPLYVTWLAAAARLWHRMAQAPAGSLLQRALQEARQLAAVAAAKEPRLAMAQQPWAAQLQRAMQEADIQFSLDGTAVPQVAEVRRAAMQHYLQRVAVAAAQPGASRLRHYFVVVRPGCLTPDGYSRAAYIDAVRERHRRLALTELRVGVHWGAEERDRLLGPARRPQEQRFCPHCQEAGLGSMVEDTQHIVFDCALYAELRQLHPQLFPQQQQQQQQRLPVFQALSQRGTLQAFLDGTCAATARFTCACRRLARQRLGLPP